MSDTQPPTPDYIVLRSEDVRTLSENVRFSSAGRIEAAIRVAAVTPAECAMRWISVEDALPGYASMVLCYMPLSYRACITVGGTSR